MVGVNLNQNKVNIRPTLEGQYHENKVAKSATAILNNKHFTIYDFQLFKDVLSRKGKLVSLIDKCCSLVNFNSIKDVSFSNVKTPFF